MEDTTRTYTDGTLRRVEDDETRTVYVYDEQGGLVSETAYTPDQNALADIRVAARQYQEAKDQYLQELVDGLPAILAAKEQAQTDYNAMDALIADLTAKRDGVAAFVVPATYNAATITAIKNELVSIRNNQILQAQYRKAVDQNAVITDNALLWLARVLTDTILD